MWTSCGIHQSSKPPLATATVYILILQCLLVDALYASPAGGATSQPSHRRHLAGRPSHNPLAPEVRPWTGEATSGHALGKAGPAGHKYTKPSDVYKYQPSYLQDVPKEVWNTVFDAGSITGTGRYQADEPDDEDLEVFEAALHHIEEMSSCSSTRCKEPQPFVMFMHDPFNRNKVYMPQCTVLHRCMNFTGCCGDSSRECVPKKTAIVHRGFIVMDLFGGQEDFMSYDPSMATLVALVNHTECECREKPRLKRCEKGCPVPFRLMREGHSCTCQCFPKANEDGPQCEGVKEGVVPLSHDGLVCIKEGHCYSPVCEVGEFDIKSGHCPLSDKYSLQPYLFQNPEDRRHYRKHLRNFDFSFQVDVPRRVYMRYGNGKVAPKNHVPSRGISETERKKRVRQRQIEALKKGQRSKEKAVSTVRKKEGQPFVVKQTKPRTTQSVLGKDPANKRQTKTRHAHKNPRHGGTFTSRDFLQGKFQQRKKTYFKSKHRRPLFLHHHSNSKLESKNISATKTRRFSPKAVKSTTKLKPTTTPTAATSGGLAISSSRGEGDALGHISPTPRPVVSFYNERTTPEHARQIKGGYHALDIQPSSEPFLSPAPPPPPPSATHGPLSSTETSSASSSSSSSPLSSSWSSLSPLPSPPNPPPQTSLVAKQHTTTSHYITDMPPTVPFIAKPTNTSLTAMQNNLSDEKESRNVRRDVRNSTKAATTTDPESLDGDENISDETDSQEEEKLLQELASSMEDSYYSASIEGSGSDEEA